jgi:integrase
MASLTKHPKSRFWVACYTAKDGRQLKRSTKTTNRGKAMHIALELERVEQQARQGTVTTTQLQKILSDTAERVAGDSLTVPTVKAYLEDWLKTVVTRNAATTVERYENAVRLFLESLGAKAGQPVSSVTPKDFETFVNRRLESGVAPKTSIIDLKILNTAFRRAEAYGIILKNPVAAVRPPRMRSSEREVFTHAEVQKLLDAAPSLEWQTLILLGYFIGARLSDCVHMKWEHVRPADGVVVYQQQKTGKKVIVPMHYHVIEHVHYLSRFGTNGFLCPTLANKGPGGKHGLSESFKRIVKKAGVDLMIVQGAGRRKFTKRTFHSLRHSFNSALANAGVAEEVRMKLTGHSTRAVNTHYTHLQVATLKNAVSSLPLFTHEPKKERPPPN